MKDLNKMSINELLNFSRIPSKELEELINDKEYLLNLNIQKLNIIFLNVNDEYKKILLNDFEIFDKIMSIPLNRMKKSIIDLVNNNVKEYIYNNKNLINSVNGKRLLEEHFKKLSPEKMTKVLEIDNLKEVFKVDILEYINNKFNIDNYLKTLIISSINNNKFNALSLLKIKNEVELLIYSKFNILVSTNIRSDGIYINDTKLDYYFLKNVNRKHIVSLIESIKSKEDNINDNKLFISAIKIYTIFGLDNSKKIINGFFTYATPASLKRVSHELFKENRREFRLKNQNKFYYHDMEDDFLEAIDNNNLEFFRNFCLDTSNEYIINLISSTKQELLCLSKFGKYNKVKEIIDKEIIKREEYYQKIDTEKFYKYFSETSRTTKISYEDLYNIFKDINIPYVLSKDGKIIINNELNKFLLGNFKKDNDCLLRMVFNGHAFGLNREFYNIINHFEEITKVINKNSDLSLNSISDVIDISKVFLYNLKPNELDITLETLSKILNSRKYCTEDPSIILERIMNLHTRRKRKVASAIEQVKGEYNSIKYKVANFDSEDLLVSGIDTGSCFKVGGKGEEFFDYCLTSPKGVVFYIEYNNIKYVLPSTINGNMLNINSIDPIIEEQDIFDRIIDVIKHFSIEIVNNPNNKIELVTITDIHLNKFFDNNNFEAIHFKEYIPLNTSVYCDYNKKDVTNYIVYKKSNKIKAEYFDNQDLFYEKRNIPYVISPDHEYDKERMNIRINSIAYSSIDYLNLSLKEKTREKYCYMNKDLNDYIYIVGNKDWYIGIKKDRITIDRYLLPYDKRALNEFNNHLKVIEESLTHTRSITK